MLTVIFFAEYSRRVKTRTFLVVTFLVPIVVAGGIGGIAAVLTLSALAEAERLRERVIAVFEQDERNGSVLAMLRRTKGDTYRLVEAADTLDAAKEAVLDGRHYALLALPPRIAEGEIEQALRLYVAETQSPVVQAELRRAVFDAVREVRLAPYRLPAEVRSIMDEQPAFAVVTLSGEGEEEGSSANVATAVGLGIALFVVALAGIYGGTVMQVVMEDKSSRMAEIVLSSVDPFRLLMGKVLAVAAVAATQIAIWTALLLAALFAVASGSFPGLVDPNIVQALPGTGGAGVAGTAAMLSDIRYDVLLAVLFLLPLGYLINASLFAALGAMHENPWEAQMSVALAMAPSILAFALVQAMVVAPNSGLVTFGAFFPFTAPALMPARMLMADVAAWQVLLSIGLCAVSTVGMIWLSARIFRGSLLIYGKKLTLGDLRRIVFAD